MDVCTKRCCSDLFIIQILVFTIRIRSSFRIFEILTDWLVLWSKLSRGVSWICVQRMVGIELILETRDEIHWI